VVFALVLTTGLHWAALQTVAWTTMLANNLCTQTVAEAVSETFDGAHPCPLCKAIAAAKKSQQKSGFAAQAQKLEYPTAPKNFDLVVPAQFQILPPANFSAQLFPQKPPVPPPRAFFV